MLICFDHYYNILQVRSLADSDSVFESACDFNEVLLVILFIVSYYYVQNLLDDTVEEGEITSEVF